MEILFIRFYKPTVSKCSKLEKDRQVHTIFIKADRSKVLQILPRKVYDYTANTCERSVLKDIPGERQGLLYKFYIAMQITRKNYLRHIFNTITSNKSSFGCPIIYTDTIHCVILFHKHLNNAWYSKVHFFLFGRPYLAIVASNVLDILYGLVTDRPTNCIRRTSCSKPTPPFGQQHRNPCKKRHERITM